MEIPEYFTRPSARRTKRARKTEDETDPDFDPFEGKRNAEAVSIEEFIGQDILSLNVATVASELQAPTPQRKISRPSRSLEFENSASIPVKIQYIDRPEHSIQDSRKIATANAVARRSNGRGGGRKRGRALQHASGSGQLVIKGGETALGLVQRVKNDFAEYELNLDQFSLEALPKYVMGTGKGAPGGPPKYEFNSLWNQPLLPLTGDITEEDFEANCPWKKDPVKPEEECLPEVVAIVAGFSLGMDLDLKFISGKTANIEYKSDKFAPIVMRLAKPKVTAMIFKNGRVVVTGAKSEEECKIASRRVARQIQKVQGYEKVGMWGYAYKNVATHCYLKFRVRLAILAQNKMYGDIHYDPTLFGGAIIPLVYPRVNVIVFASGSLIITGAKTVSQCREAFHIVYPLIKMYAP